MARGARRIEIQIAADDDASRIIDKVAAEVRNLDDAEIDIGVDESKFGGVADKLSGIADSASAIPGPLGDAAGLLGGAGGLAAGATAVGAGLLAAATSAADTALEVSTLAEVMGTSVEDASRLKVVFEDAGIEANDLADIALQVTGSLTDAPDLAARLGLSMEDAAEPATALKAAIDNWDFLSATEKSQAFGEEGVRQIGRLIAQGGDLEDLLANVDAGQIIDERDVAEARNLKAQMQELSNAFDSISTTIGQAVVPGLADAAFLASQITSALESAANAVPGGSSVFEGITAGSATAAVELGRVIGLFEDAETGADKWVTTTVDGAIAAATELAATNDVIGQIPGYVDEGTDAWKETRDAADEAAAAALYTGTATEQAERKVVPAAGRMESAFGRIEQAWDDLTASLNNREAIIRIEGAFEDSEAAAREAWDAAKTGADDADSKLRNYELSVIDLQNQLTTIAGQYNNLPSDVETKIIANVTNPDEARRVLDAITAPRIVSITPRVNPVTGNKIPASQDDVISGFGRAAPTTNNYFLSHAEARTLQQERARWDRVNGSRP